MLLTLTDSDGETMNSSQSSSLSSSSSSSSSSHEHGRCSNLSRSSTDIASFSPSNTKPLLSLSSSSDSSRRRSLSLHDFHLLRRIGRGDMGTVYLCRLRNENESIGGGKTNPLVYAMKVVDKREVEKKKSGRAEVEKRVLRNLDHPFLPTLYADFETDAHYSCVVMEFCPGGDLHTLRHRQHDKRFSLTAAKFYAAEVLVALQYLHFLGVVYRDLKPENVLLRGDGHIMLSDFDLALESTSSPSLHQRSPVQTTQEPKVSCLPFMNLKSKTRNKVNVEEKRMVVVAEPVEARSKSFVGTHEYVAPEVASGSGHGSAVDWWAFGILLYELLYGKTPFFGETNRCTLRNIIKQPLSFPSTAASGDQRHAKDLITRLLVKDPNQRLGSVHGAAEVKDHPFFSGINFALLRSQQPPFVPGNRSKSCKSRPGDSHISYF